MAIVGTTVISVITAGVRLDVTPLSLPRYDLADTIFYGYLAQLVPSYPSPIVYCNPTYNFTASPELGLIELVTLLLREVIRQHCFIAPIQ